MLYHFAITPDAFEPSAIPANSLEAVVLVELLRGIADNGLIANLQGGAWHKTIKAQYDVDVCAPDIRDKLRACLNLIHDRGRLIRHPVGTARPEDDDFRWLHWAMERHRSDATYPFKGIVATDTYIDLSGIQDAALVPLPCVFDHPCWQDRPKSIRLPKTEVQLKSALIPLLRYAERVTLIDPYMTCRKDRFFNTVQQCADLLGKHDGHQQRGLIQIHAGDPLADGDDAHKERAKDRLDRWEQELKPVIAHWKHKFEVTLWRNNPGGKSFHDRYIITDQCGISVPGGLDFGDDPARANLTSWSLLEPAIIADVLLREFNPSKSPYQRLDSRKFS
jgi:hypothetical protein